MHHYYTQEDIDRVEYLMSGSPRSYPARSPGVASTPTVTRLPPPQQQVTVGSLGGGLGGAGNGGTATVGAQGQAMVMPGFPLRAATVPHYSPYSPSRFHIDKRCQHRCSWKCFSIALILVAVALTAMLAYFAAVSSMRPIDSTKCIVVQDIKAVTHENAHIHDSISTQIPTEESLPTSTAEHSSAADSANEQQNDPQTQQSAQQWPAVLELQAYNVAHSSVIQPYTFWNTEFRNKQQAFLRLNLTLPWGANFAVYGRRNVAPSVTQYDFVEFVKGGRIVHRLKRDVTAEAVSFMKTGSQDIVHLERAVQPAISYHPHALVKRTIVEPLNTVNVSLLQYFDTGDWFLSVYNDELQPYKVTLVITEAEGVSTTCPNDCSGRGSCYLGKCDCIDGYQGADCSKSVCPVLCSSHGQYGGGMCHCEEGWKGAECDIPLGDCQVPDCNQHGQCVRGSCVCNPGWKGAFCDEPDCADPNCNGHGACVSGKCYCKAGWQGERCNQVDQQVYQCLPGCSDHGTYDLESAACVCEEHWTGVDCSQPSCGLDCGPHGSCEQGRCKCHDDWTGTKCDQKPCDARCAEHGQCKNGTCVCSQGWNGRHCTLPGCENGCSRHGLCTLQDGEYSCECSTGWAGRDCSIRLELECNDYADNDEDGMMDCSDSECCSHESCSEHIMCLASNNPVDVLLRKQPPSVTASFYQRVKFLVEENSVQSYAHMDEYTESIGENGPWNATKEIITPHNETFYTVENLRPFTVYSFRVAAINALGRSKPSQASYYMVTLREIPEGKPTITAAHNTSATSIYLAWKPPNRDTIHGEFLGYRIGYRRREKADEEMKNIYIRDPAVDNHSIHNLDTFTQYLVSLQIFNPEGHGPASTVTVMTDEGAPTKPENLTSRGITGTTIELSWSEPENANGVIAGYRVYYMHANYTDVKMHIPDKSADSYDPNIDFLLKELNPYTEYKIWVKAYTRKNEGEPSDQIIRRTDIIGPTAPLILNVTCHSQESLYVHWARPATFWGSIDYYYIHYRTENGKTYEEIEVPAEKNHLESSTHIPNLTLNTYEVVVRGATKSTIDSRPILGESSVPSRVQVTRDCDKITWDKIKDNKDLSAGVIAGMICACFAVMLAIMSFVLWKPIFRKCFNTAYYYLDYPPRNVPTLQEWENSEQDGERTAVAVQQFVQHVASLHADGDIGFSKEYELIQSETGDYTVENSQFAENKAKNRYLNILAYDHTRVQLLSCGGGPPRKGQDYVNANYIDGWQRARAYIGTQGPLPPTFDGFWRMVWEQRVSIVVMITNLVERGRRKCDMYWPKEGTETYGYIQVTLVREDIMATYTIRTLQIRHLKIKKKKNGTNMGERTIWQYHYTGWPDHGVPDHPLPVLSFIRKSSDANPPDAGPIVVHCSAGVGRTGTYIVIDAMLKQAKAKNEINVFGFLKHIRTQRNFLVQTEEQYIFIHDALQEAIESGETNIDANNLMQHVQDMLCPSNNKIDAWNNIEAQYKLVTSWKPKDFNLVSATKACNVHKNRNMDIIPIENSRVHLTPKPGVDGSDYINATWVSGFQRNREFIITQHPMENTIMEFWQMMWDHNAQTIVMLTQCDEEYPEFWPIEGKDLESETFRVRLCGTKETVNGTILLEVAVRSLQDDYELSARIVQAPANQNGLWPHNNNPKTFVNIIQDFHRDYQNGPIVVMDRYGGVEAALFILLTTLNKQLEFEQSADIYMFAKLLYMKRPGVFCSKEEYVLLYQCLESMLSMKGRAEPDLYAMANGHVAALNNPNEIRSASSIQHMSLDYPSKSSVIREYATVEVSSEYLSDYTIPIRVDHPIESSSSRGSEPCLSSHSGSNDHVVPSEKGMVVSQRNISYHNHPPSGVSVMVDANGYITNGSMRVPSDSLEPSCKMMPQ